MMTKYNERVSDYQKISYGKYIVKLKDDGGLEDEAKTVNTLPLQLAASLLSNIKKIMNNLNMRFMGFVQTMFILQIQIVHILKIIIGIS